MIADKLHYDVLHYFQMCGLHSRLYNTHTTWKLWKRISLKLQRLEGLWWSPFLVYTMERTSVMLNCHNLMLQIILYSMFKSWRHYSFMNITVESIITLFLCAKGDWLAFYKQWTLELQISYLLFISMFYDNGYHIIWFHSLSQI